MPPPILNQVTSALVGKFCPIHIRNISTTPMVKAKLRKLCAYLAHSDQALKLSSPSHGRISSAAEGDVQPGDAEDDEGRRREPVHEALERGEAHELAPGAAALDVNGAAPQIEDDEQREHAEDGDAADPFQPDRAEFAPFAAGRMNEIGGLLVGNADVARRSRRP